METKVGQETRRIPELDGLRGIAILMVLAFHYLNNQLIQNLSVVGKFVAKVTSFGWIGVDLFFVLSGFLIGGILYRYKDSKNFFSTFYIRRLVRIVPNYYLLVLVFIAISSMNYFSGSHFLTGGKEVPVWSYFAMVHNLFMAKFNTLGNDAMSVTWSIGIEEQFYIIFPFVVYFLDMKYIPYFLLLAIVSANFFRAQFEHWIPPYVLLPCRMDAIAFGALVAWLSFKEKLHEVVVERARLVFLMLAVVTIVCAVVYFYNNDLGVLRNSIFAFIFSVLLALTLVFKDSVIGIVLRNRYLMWIGTISYSLYLFHYLILGLSHKIFAGQDGVILMGRNDIFITIGALSFALFFSWFVYKYLEYPFVKMGKKFKY